MTAQAIHASRAPNLAAPILIEEDSFFQLAIARIPYSGFLFSWPQERSLAEKINGTQDAARLIELIVVRNKYLCADLDRNLFTAAVLVANVGVGIIQSTCGYLGAGASLAGVALHVYQIYHNNQVLKELRTNGVFRPGMRVC